MLGGKQKFHGQSGFYEATMRGAVMKKVSGQRFQLDVLEELGLPVTHAMRARFAQIDAERDFKRNFLYANPKEAIKRLRRKAQLKHAAWRQIPFIEKPIMLIRLGLGAFEYSSLKLEILRKSLKRPFILDGSCTSGSTPASSSWRTVSR